MQTSSHQLQTRWLGVQHQVYQLISQAREATTFHKEQISTGHPISKFCITVISALSYNTTPYTLFFVVTI